MVFRPESLAAKLTFYLGGLFMAMFGGLILLWYFGAPSVPGAREKQVNEALHFLEQAASYRIAMMNRIIEERRGDLFLVAENSAAVAALEHKKQDVQGVQGVFGQVFGGLQRAYPDIYSELTLVDPRSKRVLASSDPATVGSVFADQSLIERATQPGVSELIEEVAGQDKETLAVVRQVLSDKVATEGDRQLLGVVVATLDMNNILAMSNLVDGFTAPLPERSLVFASSGRLLAERPAGGGNHATFARDAQGASGFEGSLIVAGAEGRVFLAVYRHFPLSGGVGWTLVEYSDRDAVLAKLHGQLYGLVFLGLLLTLAGLLLVGLIARRATGPLRHLAVVARHLGGGDFSVRSAMGPKNAQEIRDLSLAFNEMAARIQVAHLDLEEKVRVRTHLLIQERDLTQGYLDVARVMLMALDRNGRITMINRHGAELLGSPVKMILGQDWFGNFLLAGDQEVVRKVFESIMRGETAGVAEYENSILTADGRELRMAWHNATLLNDAGEPHGILSSGEDITERHRAADAMQTMFAELEDRVAVRTHELAESNDSLRNTLDHLQRAQKDLVQKEKLASLGALVAGVAHELNTPLGNSVTISSTLVDDLEVFSTEFNANTLTKRHLKEYIEHTRQGFVLLSRGLERANVLVSNFKRVATDQSSEARRRFDLAQTVQEVVDTIAPQFKHTPHRIRVDIPMGILLDSYPGPLGQVVTNLSLNALIHAFSDDMAGEVRISIESAPHGMVSLTVSDNGRGIAPEHLPKIFDPFFTTRLGQGGSGLGLNIVDNLVRGVLEGYIRVESHLGQGTRFTIDLPMVPVMES